MLKNIIGKTQIC